jgi:hypothetical protein
VPASDRNAGGGLGRGTEDAHPRDKRGMLPITHQSGVHFLFLPGLNHRVSDQLSNVSKLSTWAEESGDNAFNLPSFSAYPMGCVCGPFAVPACLLINGIDRT